MWVAYALSQLPSGVFADRFGEQRTVLAALMITAFASLGLAVAPSFFLFGICVCVLGIGAGTYYNPATALLAREFDEIGGAIGAHRIGGQIAGVLGPLIVALITVWFRWRTVIVVGAIFALFAAVLFRWQYSQNQPLRSDASLRELFDLEALSEVLTRSHTRSTTFMMTLVEFVGLAAMAFLPTLLFEQYGLSIRRANFLFAVFFAVSALCQPVGGRLSDQFGRDRIIGIQASAGVVGYSILAVGRSVFLAIPVIILAGVAMSATPVLQSRMMDGLTDKTLGTGFGLFRMLYLLIGATGTAVVGTTADIAGWTSAFSLLSVLFAVVLVVGISLKR